MNDNRKLLIDVMTFEPQKQSLTEALSGSGPFIVKGILQRADVKNQNGRSYPFSTLQRESQKYNEHFIKERRALGELDHPECLRETAKILTKNGWKFIKDIFNDEEILTLNIKTNKPEYQKITKKIDQPYKGEMYHLQGKNIDTYVTPNHRFVIEDRYGNRIFKTAEELFELNNQISTHLKIPKSNDCWEMDSKKTFVLNGVSENDFNKRMRNELKEKYSKSIEIDYTTWMSFIGIYLAEGHTNRTKGNGDISNKKTGRIFLTQIDPEKTDKIINLISSFPSELKWSWKTSKNGKTTFSISDARLFKYLYPLGSCYDKYIPQELKDQSTELLECLLEWYHIGDGRNVWNKGYNSKSIFSTSRKLMEDFQEVLLKIGMCSNITEDKCTKDYKFAERIIKKERKSPLYVLRLNTSKYIHIDNRFLKITKENFDGRVYCVQVPNQTFYCEENGKCFWSGNSQVVNLKNVSHNVIEMHWEDKDLMGTVEVLSTPSGNILKELFRSNIRLGISSRGLGTVKKISEGLDQVQDDFELIAFDFVSNPSTRGAFMFPQSSLTEGVNLVKNPINNKWVTAEIIIQDIFNELN
jgi:hypothetical protein